jgi:hypothetical protein
VKDIRIERDLLATIRRLAPTQRRQVGGAIAAAQESFGSPHRHGGAGLRKLQGRWYEVRAGLQLRLLFRDCDDCLSFEFIGDHDAVRHFLKSAP